MTYWITTTLLALFLLWSAYSYIFSQPTIEGIRDLGFPDFFRIQLAVLKLIASITLVLPGIPNQIKEWAYVGVALFLITAIIAHTAHRDSIVLTLINLCLFAMLVISRYTLQAI